MAVITLEFLQAELEAASLRIIQKMERFFEQKPWLEQDNIQANEGVIKEEELEEIQFGAPMEEGMDDLQMEKNFGILEEISQIRGEIVPRVDGIFKVRGRNPKGISQFFFKNEILTSNREEYFSKGYIWTRVQIFKTLKLQLQNQETLKLQLQNQDFAKFKKDEIRRIRKKVRKKDNPFCWKG